MNWLEGMSGIPGIRTPAYLPHQLVQWSRGYPDPGSKFLK